jgi:formate hydrogenlyase subunit 3/multisubunit Na+/H+ antiporter MnhD subunit
VLAVVSLVLGGIIYAVAYAARETPATVVVTAGGAAMAGGGIFTGGEPLSGEGRLTASDFSSIFLQNWHEFFRWSNVDRVYLAVWSGLQAVSRAFGVVVSWMEQQATFLVIVLAVFNLAAIRWLTPEIVSLPTGAAIPVPQMLVAACALAATALIVAALAQSKTRSIAGLMVLVSIPTIVGLASADPWLRLGLLELGALLTIPLVWQTARTRSAKLTYLAVVLLSALTLVASDLLLERGQAEWARALLLTSVCIKLAAVPLFFWLLKLADELPALVLGIIIAVVDMAAFGELYIAAHASPGMFTPTGLWFCYAASTSFLAALLMLSQRSLKRLLVLSTVEDVGFLLFGLASITTLGTTGALVAAVTHSLAKALLFICLAGPEAGGALEGNQTGLVNSGLISRYPVCAFGFLFGMLAMLGIPPTVGFIGRWKLYETAVQIGWPLAATFIVSSILALVAYVLALTGIWWGPPSNLDSPPGHHAPETIPKLNEPWLLKTVIVLLVALILAAGVWPSLLDMLKWGRL